MSGFIANWNVFAFSLNCVLLIALVVKPSLFGQLSRRSTIIIGAMMIVMFAGVTLDRLLFGSGSARVFQSLWASGDALWRGFDPYSVLPSTWVITYRDGSSVTDLNLNPPTLLPLFQLVALVPAATAAAVWAVVSATLYIGGIALSTRPETRPIPVGWAFLLPIVGDTLLLGQIYTGLFAFAVAIWIGARENKLFLAGIALGTLVAIKPNFGLCIIMLLAAGHFRLAFNALATATFLCCIPVVLYGVEIYESWLAAAANDQHYIFSFEISLAGYFSRIGSRPAGLIAGGVLAVVLVAFAYKVRPNLRSALLLGLTGSVLASPLGWYHYLIVLVPALIERPWSRLEAIAAGLLFVPIAIPEMTRALGPLGLATIGGIYTIAALLLLASFLVDALVRNANWLGSREHLSSQPT